MKVYLGNANPLDQGTPVPGPAITISDIRDTKNEDGSYTAGYIIGSDAAEMKEYLYDNPGPVSHFPGNGAALNVVMSWRDHSASKPSWVSVEADERDPAEAEDFERFLSDFWKIPRGVPADVEDTHYTQHNNENRIYAPGESPEGV